MKRIYAVSASLCEETEKRPHAVMQKDLTAEGMHNVAME